MRNMMNDKNIIDKEINTKSYRNRRSMTQYLVRKINNIDKLLISIKNQLDILNNNQDLSYDLYNKKNEMMMNDLFNLPDHLKKTILTLIDLGGEADALSVSLITTKARAVESSYLNQLCNMGFLKSIRENRRVIFTLNKQYKYYKNKESITTIKRLENGNI